MLTLHAEKETHVYPHTSQFNVVIRQDTPGEDPVAIVLSASQARRICAMLEIVASHVEEELMLAESID